MSDDNILHRLDALTATVDALTGVVEQQARRRTPSTQGHDPAMMMLLDELRAARAREGELMRAMLDQRAGPDPMQMLEVVMSMQQSDEKADRDHRLLDMLEKGMSIYAISKAKGAPGHRSSDATGGEPQPEPPADA